MEDFTEVVASGRRKITETGMGTTELMKSNFSDKENQ